ncbi:MAG: DNA repair protein RecO [Nitrospirota bacterium]
MLHRTYGVVLRTFPFAEADLIVTYLTPDLGLLKLFAKSPRKIKSRFGSSLEPLTHTRISFWGKEDASLPRLTQSDIIHSFHCIRNSLDCILLVSEILELTLAFVPERDANGRIYTLLLDTLKAIEDILLVSHQRGGKSKSSHCNLAVNYYKAKFLKFAGFAPKLDVCGRCGREGDRFYISHGTILCEICAEGVDSPIKITSATVKLYNNLLTWDISKIDRIKPSDTLLSDLSNIMNMHINNILARPLRSSLLFCQ